MTCVYMEGFESVMDDTDLIRKGWARLSAISLSGAGVVSVPSRTSVAGRGLMLRGPYSASTALPNQSSANPDFGLLNIGKPVNSFWNAGGFAVGFNATFNKNTQVQIACNRSQQLVFDGVSTYWACILAGGVYTVGYSTDLINWTLAPNAPPGMSIDSTLSIQGSGPSATLMVAWDSSVVATTTSFSKDGGYTWTTMTVLGTNTRGSVLTGVANAPAMGLVWVASTGFRFCYWPTLGGTPVQLATPLVGGNTTYASGFMKVVAGVIVSVSMSPSGQSYLPTTGTATFYSCPTSLDPTVGSNWLLGQNLAVGDVNDIAFFNNQWLTAGYGGIYSSTQAGTVGAVQGPNGAWFNQLNLGASSAWSIACSSTLCVAVGQDPVNTTLGAIWTSPDGKTWTKQNRFILSTTTPGTGIGFTNVIWDGSRFVITGGATNNVVAYSPDGVTWTSTYYPDYTESAVPTSLSVLGIYTGTISATGVFTQYAGGTAQSVGLGFVVGALNAGANTRTVQAGSVQQNGVVGSLTTAVTVSASPLSHYFEIIATANPGQANQYTVQWAIDGVIQGTVGAAIQFGSTGDTTGTGQTFINLPRAGNFTVIDDVYVTTMNGTTNVGQMGPISVLPWQATSDTATKQLMGTNGTLPHATQVSGPFSNSQNGVYSTNTNVKDIYNATPATIPANYNVKAAMVETFVTKNGYVGGAGTVGIVNGGNEVDSAAAVAVANAPVYTSVVTDIDPKTGLPWTNSGILTAGFAVTKTT